MQRCKASSYDYVTDGGCFEFWEGPSNSYIHHNWCSDNDDYWEAGADAAYTISNTTISENIFVNSRSAGWHFSCMKELVIWLVTDIVLAAKFAVNINSFKIINNDFYDTTSSDWYMFYGIADAPDKTQIVSFLFKMML